MYQNPTPNIKFTIEEGKPSEGDGSPWMSQHTRDIINPILRFHNEIIDYAEYVGPSKEEHEEKANIFNILKKQILEILPDSIVTNPLFKNRIYLKGTQLEVFVISKSEPNNWANDAQAILEKADLSSFSLSNDSVQPKEDYRVMCTHRDTGIMIWLTFLSPAWEVYLQETELILPEVPQLRYLFLINWCIIRQRSFHTGIKSLLILGICNFFMFQRRKQRSRTLAEGIIKFLQFFGVGSANERHIIYKGGKSFDCNLFSEQRTFTFDVAENVNISTPIIREYFKIIQNRYRVIGNYYYGPGTSILAHLVNPCLGQFSY